MTRPRPEPGPRLRVDPIACDGIGLCAHLAPDVVELDRWGYPVVATGPMTDAEAGSARRAARACPRRALWIDAGESRRTASSTAPASLP